MSMSRSHSLSEQLQLTPVNSQDMDSTEDFRETSVAGHTNLDEARRHLASCKLAHSMAEERAFNVMLQNKKYIDAKKDFESARNQAESALDISNRASDSFFFVGDGPTAYLVLLADKRRSMSWIDRICALLVQQPRLAELREIYSQRRKMLQEYAHLCDKRAEHFEAALSEIEMQFLFDADVKHTRRALVAAERQYEYLLNFRP